MNQDQQFIDMLLHEARVAATLSHPNIVQTFDVGEVEGTYFIAMEHIHGEDIRTIVRQMKKKNVVEFPLEHALSIVIGLCSGLAYAHEKRDLDGKSLGIVHRDISPQNIVITFSGDVKVVDFGVAKSLHAADEAKGGQLKGKVPYMSPEQAAADADRLAQRHLRAGVILFELTTGRRLFKGANEFETLKLITDHEYPLPSDIAPDYPMRLEQIVMKALAKDRTKRYQSARDMQADLEAFVRDERLPVSAVQLSAWMQSSLRREPRAAQGDAARHQASRRPHRDGRPQASFTMTGVHPRFDQSSTGIAAPGASSSIPAPAQKSSRATILTVLAAVVVLGGGAFFYASREKVVTNVAPPHANDGRRTGARAARRDSRGEQARGRGGVAQRRALEASHAGDHRQPPRRREHPAQALARWLRVAQGVDHPRAVWWHEDLERRDADRFGHRRARHPASSRRSGSIRSHGRATGRRSRDSRPTKSTRSSSRPRATCPSPSSSPASRGRRRASST
jgi:hypothetical protein